MKYNIWGHYYFNLRISTDNVLGSYIPRGVPLFKSVFKAGPVVEKAKGLGMTPGTSFHKGQPCPTSSASNAYSAHD